MVMGTEAQSGGTRERLMDAAQELFAERGFEGVSLRDITGAAEANVAAVNYYFGSRENLIAALVERYAGPMNEKRMALLAEAERRHGEEAVPVEEVLEAFLTPMRDVIAKSEMSERLFCKFMGRLMGERGYRLPDSVQPAFQAMAGRFASALRRAVPGLSEPLALWRMQYSFGVMANALMHGETFQQIAAGRAGDPGMDRQFRQIIDFCAAGIRAASTP